MFERSRTGLRRRGSRRSLAAVEERASRLVAGPGSGRLTGATEGSEVTLSVESSGEGHVVEGPGHGVRASVGGHAGDAVLRLVGGQLPTQLIG